METLKCPKGCTSNVARLAGGESFYRFQCGNIDCLHEWDVPHEGVKAIAIAEQEGDQMPLCVKGCGREFKKIGRNKEKHEAKCKGPKGGAQAKVAPAPSVKKPARRSATGGATFEGMLEFLKTHREELIAKATVEIDAAIEGLTALIEKNRPS